MKFGLLSNPKGEMIIIHNVPLGQDVSWIEYTPQEEVFYIIYEDGQSEKLDLNFSESMKNNIINGTEVNISYIDDKKVLSNKIVTILIKEY